MVIAGVNRQPLKQIRPVPVVARLPGCFVGAAAIKAGSGRVEDYLRSFLGEGCEQVGPVAVGADGQRAFDAATRQAQVEDGGFAARAEEFYLFVNYVHLAVNAGHPPTLRQHLRNEGLTCRVRLDEAAGCRNAAAPGEVNESLHPGRIEW